MDGASALAVGIDLLSRERSASATATTRQDIEDLLGDGRYFAQPRFNERWTHRLEALGHSADDADAPVMVRWRALCRMFREPPVVDFLDNSYRSGFTGASRLRLLMSPFHRDRTRF